MAFLLAHKSNGVREKGRLSASLPSYSSTVHEKLRQAYYGPWIIRITVSVPGMRSRRLRLPVPNLVRLHYLTTARLNRRRGLLLLGLVAAVTIFTVVAISRRFGPQKREWPKLISDPPTLVFRRDDLQRIWKWEVESGHYPSSRKIPEMINLNKPPRNPSLPPIELPPQRFRPPPGPVATGSARIGPKRVYLDIQSRPPNIAYPPRPVPGSVADLDIIMEHCDFSQRKHVRDCLEVLRVGGGLDNGKRLRRGNLDDWKYIYVEENAADNSIQVEETPVIRMNSVFASQVLSSGFTKKPGVEWEEHLDLPSVRSYKPYVARQKPCDDEYPRLFHMFWTGPFTDKPYLAILSFLYTQNTGMHMHEKPEEAPVCRPQFWLWINPGPAASVPNASALEDMFNELRNNPWASPFLHPRFKDVIRFKLWNTTEQLDGIPELKSEWRALKDTLFNSGGHVIKVPPDGQKSSTSSGDEFEMSGNATAAARPSPTNMGKTHDDDMLGRLGSKSSSSYDRLSVILSDMARFILCHRFGGIYLDADTIFLRDWEELWGWSGAFAYRWSRLERYNTAVLKMNKGSALGTFLFRTALKNLLDFHPMTVSLYTRDAYLEGLLLRLPDALFDSAWLNTEYYQRDRPPQPYFTDFSHFFDTPKEISAAPQALGFEGFFRGAYSYHFHNFWWKPFDPSRNWPDLGPRFAAGERAARVSIVSSAASSASQSFSEDEEWDDHALNDKRDLDWATVLKRTFEAYIRGETPNMYGEWISW